MLPRNWGKSLQRWSAFAERHKKMSSLVSALVTLSLLALFVFGGGLSHFPLLIALGIFLVGSYQLRRAKVLADVPRIPIRSVALGIVTIRGKVQPDQMVPAPVSGRPCCFFKVQIEEWDNHHGWEIETTDNDGPRLFLADETGKVLIDAHYADSLEFDPPQTAVRVVDSSISAEVTDANAPTDDEVLHYISKATVPMRRREMAAAGEDVGTWTAPAKGRYRLTEFLVLPGQEYQVTGTCTEIPNSRNEDDRIVICQGESESTFVISSKTGRALTMDKMAIGWGLIIVGSIYLLVWLIIFSFAHFD